jgi:transcription initiation factor TFIIIB Brf1 subunit/transcription initiation factor TFIIB
MADHEEIQARRDIPEGGETACWAHLVCAECGSVIGDEPHTHDPDLAPSS